MDKTKRFWLFASNITGAVAKWAVRQSPYAFPKGLESGLAIIDREIRKEIAFDTVGMALISLGDVREVLESIIMNPKNKIFVGWNTPKRGKHEVIFTSRFWTPKPDYDFIDLTALIQNVQHELWTEILHNMDFDKEAREREKHEVSLSKRHTRKSRRNRRS